MENPGSRSRRFFIGVRPPRDDCLSMAGSPTLWPRNGPLVTAPAAHNGRNDRLFARRSDGHAFRRYVHHCHGQCRGCPWPDAQQEYADSSPHTVACANSVWILPGSRGPCQGPRGDYSLWRRGVLLGFPDQTAEGRASTASSSSYRIFLRYCRSLVRSLQPPQSRFLARVYYRS